MKQPAKLLVVDDEPNIRHLLCSGLARAGYQVLEAADAREALDQVQRNKPEIVLLDLGLPDRDGLELVPLIKASGAAVLVVSARDGTGQKVAALDLGADDYITKPFETEELLARIRTALRHRAPRAWDAPIRCRGEVEIDLALRLVRKRGVEIHLAPKEFEFLAELAKRPGAVVTHAQLLSNVWGAGHESDVEYLRVAARGIRKKLDEDPAGTSAIRNEPGIGYRLMV